MNKLCILLLSGLLCDSLSAQKSIISEGAESITIAELRDHIFYLASDELEGRKSGTAGYDKAVQYVVTQMRQAGLTPVYNNNNSPSYCQNITIARYSPDLNNAVTIVKDSNNRTYTYEEDFIVGYGGPFETKELSAGLVFVGAGIREPEYGIDDYKNMDVKGKWAVILEDMPLYLKEKLPREIAQKYFYPPENRKLIVQQAKDEGAVGIIFIPNDYHFKNWKITAEAYRDFYTIPGTGQLWVNTALPTVLIDSAMIKYLFTGQKYNPLEDKKSYQSFGLKNCDLTFHKEYTSSTIHTANVISLIEGSDPVLKNEYITLCAHLDHLGIQHGNVMNGADDNASGSAAVLEIAEALSMTKPERSIICMLFAGEEIYFQGSYYFTEKAPVPIENIIVNINLDMIGSSDTDVKGLAPLGAGSITPKLKEVISEVSERAQYVSIDWAYAETDRYVNMSDHYPFHLKKIPAVFFSSGDNADIHMPSDDAGKFDFDFFQRSCRLIYEIIMELANGDENFKNNLLMFSIHPHVMYSDVKTVSCIIAKSIISINVINSYNISCKNKRP
jgi:hypothetical protein